MTMEQKQDSPYSTDEKLRWEVEKLKAEVKAQERSPYRNPSLLVAVFTAFLGLAGIWIQYVKSDMAYQLAEIKKEQTMLEIEKLNQQRAETDQLLARAQQELEATLASYKEKERQYKELENALNQAKEALAAREQQGQASPAAAEAVKDASVMLRRASRSNQADAASSGTTLRRIKQLRSDVSKKAPRGDSR